MTLTSDDLPLRITPTPVGLGCAPVLGRVGRREALWALSRSLDAGVNCFDVARSYGYGEAEALLGEFLRGRRDQVLLSTKAGILARPQSTWRRTARSLLRPVLTRFAGAKRALRGVIAGQFQPGFFSPTAVQSSIESSLRALRTDYVDILYLHDCTTEDLEREELRTALARIKAAGKALHVGVASGTAEALRAAHRCGETYTAALAPCSLLSPTLASDFPRGFLFFGREPFGGVGGLAALKRAVAEGPGPYRQPTNHHPWPGARSLSDHEVAELALSWAAFGSGAISTIASFFEPAHVEANLRLLKGCPVTRDRLTAITLCLRSGRARGDEV